MLWLSISSSSSSSSGSSGGGGSSSSGGGSSSSSIEDLGEGEDLEGGELQVLSRARMKIIISHP